MFLWTRLKAALWGRPHEKKRDEEAHMPTKAPGKQYRSHSPASSLL